MAELSPRGCRLTRAVWAAAVLLVLSSASVHAADPADTPEQREAAAAQLFEIPLYRELTTRQVYEALESLPEPQRRKGVAALRDPKVVQVLRQAVIRSTATTFSVREIDVVRRFLEADEARSIVGKLDQFRVALLREAVTAAIVNPDLAPLLLPQ